MTTGEERVDLSIVMPAWNEVDSIGGAVDEARRSIEQLRSSDVIESGEIIVVDDGSSDGTHDVLSTASEACGDLVVLTHSENKGVGAAIRWGLESARGRLVFYTDADMPVSLDVIPEAIELLAESDADIVVGFRRTRRDESRRRQLYGWVYNRLVSVVFGIRFRDVNFAAKLFTSGAISRLESSSSGILIDAELLVRARQTGMLVLEMPMDYQLRQHGSSSMSSPRRILGLYREMRTLRSAIRSSPLQE